MKKLTSPRFPSLLSKVVQSNQFLKMFSIYALLLSLVTMSAFFYLVSRGPTIITLNTESKALEQTSLPRAETQVEEALRTYVHHRYQWEPKNVLLKLKRSESFIRPQTLKTFRESVSKIATFASEKVVSQKAYVNELTVDLEKNVARVSGDRVTTIQGMKAAGEFDVEFFFESGPRTAENPWGIYVSQEKEKR